MRLEGNLILLIKFTICLVLKLICVLSFANLAEFNRPTQFSFDPDNLLQLVFLLPDLVVLPEGLEGLLPVALFGALLLRSRFVHFLVVKRPLLVAVGRHQLLRGVLYLVDRLVHPG